jgi:hypothetical protein
MAPASSLHSAGKLTHAKVWFILDRGKQIATHAVAPNFGQTESSRTR